MKHPIHFLVAAVALLGLGTGCAALEAKADDTKGTTVISSTVTFNRVEPTSFSGLEFTLGEGETISSAVLYAGPTDGRPDSLSDLADLAGTVVVDRMDIGTRDGTFSASDLPPTGGADYAIAVVVSFGASSDVRVFFAARPGNGSTANPAREDFVLLDVR
jgi:hypothetical protein